MLTTSERRKIMKAKIKGSLVGTEVIDDRLQLWFSSPTGDSSDSVILTMPCKSNAEALELQDYHRKVYGLASVHLFR
tara:strand:- start:277 stop:507 length:231 start_codon:yes stop_codon:yes gene_type:complete